MSHRNPRRARVLLAEDDHEFRRLVAGMLRRNGYVVDEAATGLDMLSRLADVAVRRRKFDLIVSDVRMPGMSGLQVIEGMQLSSGLRRLGTPVIFMTAFGDRDLRDQASRLGATILDKPFDLDDLALYAELFAPAVEDPPDTHDLGNGD
ncbi:MAG: response regulator [Deltaproteobacteria bacterium]|nr:response regulator [Deltaproteobacteria bacterium]